MRIPSTVSDPLVFQRSISYANPNIPRTLNPTTRFPPQRPKSTGGQCRRPSFHSLVCSTRQRFQETEGSPQYRHDSGVLLLCAITTCPYCSPYCPTLHLSIHVRADTRVTPLLISPDLLCCRIHKFFIFSRILPYFSLSSYLSFTHLSY